MPREANYGYERFSHWNRTVQRNWAGYPWPDITNEFARRKNCLLGWMICVQLVDDVDVRAHVIDSIKTEGLFGDAERFRQRISRNLKDKPRILAITVKALGIPRNEVKVVRFDVKKRKRIEQPMPKA